MNTETNKMVKDSKLNSERENIANIFWIVNIRQRRQRIQLLTKTTQQNFLICKLNKSVNGIKWPNATWNW